MKVRSSIFFLLAASACLASEFHVYKSHDEGQTWTRSDNGLPSTSRINALHTLSATSFAATDAGIFISTNSAQSWTNAAPLPSNARPLAFAPIDKSLFLATDRAGVLISRDLAKSWTPHNEGLPAKSIRCLLAVDGALYAGTDHEGLFVLNPSTTTWQSDSNGLPPGAQIHDLVRVDKTLFVGLYSHGLFRRDSADQSFRKIGDKNPLLLAAQGNSLVIGLNPGGIYATDDLGQTFHRWKSPSHLSPIFGPALSPDAPVWAMAATAKRVFAGAASGVYVSDDAGKNWTSSGLPSDTTAIAFVVTPDFILTATTTHAPRQ